MTETLRERGSWLDRCWVLFVAERFGGGSGVVSERVESLASKVP